MEKRPPQGAPNFIRPASKWFANNNQNEKTGSKWIATPLAPGGAWKSGRIIVIFALLRRSCVCKFPPPPMNPRNARRLHKGLRHVSRSVVAGNLRIADRIR